MQDEKSSSHDFVDTLERIVNEIKNTTVSQAFLVLQLLSRRRAAHACILVLQEHSTAFLQKVKKTEVPDYYDGTGSHSSKLRPTSAHPFGARSD